MINLLPYDLKKQTSAARVNTVILKYLVVLLIGLVYVTATFLAAYMFLENTKLNNQKQLDQQITVKVPASSTQGQTDTFKSDLTIVKNIIDRQVSYSDIVIGIGTILPKGTVIDSLSINDSSIGSSINIKIRATSSSLETAVKSAFAKSTTFSNYTVISSSQEPGLPGYPVAINSSVVVNKVIAK